jgi:transposase-like protein
MKTVTVKRYSEAFKQQIVSEYQSVQSVRAAKKR